MKETWRWYGPIDKITLQEIQQTGAQGIVSALHEIPYGEVWERDAISDRRSIIRASGFHWDVVESLPPGSTRNLKGKPCQEIKD